MITNQHQLDRAGMGCLRRDSPPPKVDPRLKERSSALKAQGPSLKASSLKVLTLKERSSALKAQGATSRINPSSTSHVDPRLRLKARIVLQREADARQDSRDYQDLLIYTESDYKDPLPHWVQRPPAPLIRHKRTQAEILKAQENLTQRLPQEISRRRRRLKVTIAAPPKTRKMSREFARAILKELKELKELEC